MRFKLTEKILNEGTKYDKKAISKLVDSGLFDEEASTKIVDGLFKQDIHAFVHAPAWLEKYLIGIINMLIKHCNGDNSKAKNWIETTKDDFDEYLTYIKDYRPKLSQKEQEELDKKFNEQMSYEDMVKELEKIRTDLDNESKEKLKDMKFTSSSSYELVPIDSYEQMHKEFGGALTGDQSSDKYAGGGGTAWCHTNDKSTYYYWINKGRNKFFVLKNKNFKDIHFDRESNENNPKDDYGNSLIAILVDKETRQLRKATLRCNHVGVPTNADNQYKTYAELSEIAGFNVQEEVEKNLENEPKIEEFEIKGNTLVKFNNIDDKKKVVTPDNVKYIDKDAFAQDNMIKEVDLKNVVTIDEYAFFRCIDLKTIHFSNVISEIEGAAFLDCNSLKDVYYNGTKEQWDNVFINEGGNEDLLDANIFCLKGESGNVLKLSNLDIDKIYLLSTDEAKDLPQDVRKYKDGWWLRSPGLNQGSAARVHCFGSVDFYGTYVDYDYVCVRPALHISNLNSSDFELYSDLELYDGVIIKNGEKKVKFIYIGNGTLLYNGEAIQHRFDEKSNDYNKSEIKKFVENDFLKEVFGNKVNESMRRNNRMILNEDDNINESLSFKDFNAFQEELYKFLLPLLDKYKDMSKPQLSTIFTYILKTSDLQENMNESISGKYSDTIKRIIDKCKEDNNDWIYYIAEQLLRYIPEDIAKDLYFDRSFDKIEDDLFDNVNEDYDEDDFHKRYIDTFGEPQTDVFAYGEIEKWLQEVIDFE